jgi:hypothetical protein
MNMSGTADMLTPAFELFVAACSIAGGSVYYGVERTSHEGSHRGDEVDESRFYARVVVLAAEARFRCRCCPANCARNVSKNSPRICFECVSRGR